MMEHRSKGIAAFLLLAFGLAWIAWTIPTRWNVSTGDPLLRLALMPLAALPGGFAPAVAAFVVRKWVTREGFGDAGLEWNLGRRWPYYLFAWLSTLAVAVSIALLGIVTGQRGPGLSLQPAYEMLTSDTTRTLGDVNHPGLLLWVWLAALSLPSTFIFWGEEFGWRGYLQVRLLRGRPLLAAVATGLIWGIWHYPFYFLPSYGHESRHSGDLLVFPVSTILLSIIFGWLRQRTGSVWVVSLAHASVNCLGANLVMLWFLGEPSAATWSYLGMAGWVPLGAICAWLVFSKRLESL
jgi:membrane protease YdiL (CAAX protease family)